MSFKKWLLIFFGIMVAVAAVSAGFMIAIDPFGVYGDHILNWYDYDMTKNPRIAKIEYLDRHYQDYDAYIIGSSKTSSYPVEQLNNYYDANFYNMLVYGGDLFDDEQITEYVIEHYNVKHIILNIGLEEAAGYDTEPDPVGENLHAKLDDRLNVPLFYLKYAFMHPQYAFDKIAANAKRDYLPTKDDVFKSSTGEFNKTVRDVEKIGNESDYLNEYPAFGQNQGTRDLKDIDKCVESVQRIKQMCEKKGITFLLIASPSYQGEVRAYDKEQVRDYYQKLSSVTPFYDFSGYTSISSDGRYFYDVYHFRNSVGKMALAYMFGDSSIYVPENFGRTVTMDNVDEVIEQYFTEPTEPIDRNTYQKKVSILMYHNLDEKENDNDMSISPQLFESHLQAMQENGYTAISFQDLINYVEKGIEIPDKSVIITFDDGYLSNYQYAYPLLVQYQMKGTIFCIGVSMGKDTYKDTGKAITPHFNIEQANEMIQSGVMEIQSHTYDFHNVEGLDSPARQGVSKLSGESDLKFAELFQADLKKSQEQIENASGQKVNILSYPNGIHSVLSEVCANQAGYLATVTVESGSNTVVKGLGQTLYSMKRLGITKDVTPQQLIEALER